MRAVPCAILALLLIASSAPAVRAADPLAVTTASGVLSGIETGATREWRGIPYAVPPVDDNRWRAPAELEPWAGERDATVFAERCIQPIAEFETIGTEDCLYLNVFAPASASRADSLPVMVHLHGGSNGGYRPHTNGAALVAHDVIVVTLAYRLGVFGFVGHPALTAEAASPSGEYALLDQVAALRWVQSNIEAFGGDPENVTLFGESAGSGNATALVASPLADGLFARAALQTQTFWGLHGQARIEQAEALGLEAADRFGCTSAFDDAACLRAIPAEDLVLAHGFGEFLPWVGGAVLPAPPLELIAAQESTVPLLVGSNREAAAHWFDQVFTGEAYDATDWQRDSDWLAGPEAGSAIRDLYQLDAFDSPLWAAVAAFTDAVYACPARRLAAAASSSSSGPVYGYTYAHVLENDEFLAGVRAGQFLEEPILWHAPELLYGLGIPGYLFSDGEEKLAARMAAYWTNFAKTGDPNGRALPAWPAYDASGEQTIVLDQPIGGIHQWPAEACAFFDTIPLTGQPAEFTRRHVPSVVLDHWLEDF